jgi:YVTN family beta-propeller protein
MVAFRLALTGMLAPLAAAVFLGAAPGAAAQSVVRTIPTGAEPRAIAVNGVTNKIYVANELSNSVTVIDGATQATTSVSVGNRPQHIAVNTATNRIYVSNGDSSQTVIDGATLRTTMLPTGGNGPMVVSEATNSIYLLRLGNTDEVTRIRGADHTWHTMATDSWTPVAQALNERSNQLYVANYTTGDVRMVDLSSTSDYPPTRSVPVWGRPVAVALNPHTNRIYVIGEDSRGPINVIDGSTYTAVSYAPAGHARGPRAIAVNTVTNKVYAAFTGEVMVMDGASHAMTFIPSGHANGPGPVAIAVNERSNKIYVANAQGFVTVIDGASNAVTTVPIPQNAKAIAVHAATNKVYVVAGSVTVIDGAGSASPQPPAAGPAFNVQGLWWRGPSESGWGVNLTQQGETLFATWFTYDAAGAGQWLAMSNGARSGDNAWSGTLYRTTGPALDAAFGSAPVRTTAVGSATFSFSDASSGLFTATVDGVTVTKPIYRQVYAGPVPACAAGGSAGAQPNYQDLWWRTGGGESGWGLNVTHQGDILFVTWFTYDSSGKGLWLVGSRVEKTGNATYSGTLYRTWGAPFDRQPWDPSSVRAMPVGAVTLTFSDPGNGVLSATVEGSTITKPITRQLFASPPTVCR